MFDIIWLAVNLDRRIGRVRPFQSERRRVQDAPGRSAVFCFLENFQRELFWWFHVSFRCGTWRRIFPALLGANQGASLAIDESKTFRG